MLKKPWFWIIILSLMLGAEAFWIFNGRGEAAAGHGSDPPFVNQQVDADWLDDLDKFRQSVADEALARRDGDKNLSRQVKKLRTQMEVVARKHESLTRRVDESDRNWARLAEGRHEAETMAKQYWEHDANNSLCGSFYSMGHCPEVLPWKEYLERALREAGVFFFPER